MDLDEIGQTDDVHDFAKMGAETGKFDLVFFVAGPGNQLNQNRDAGTVDVLRFVKVEHDVRELLFRQRTVTFEQRVFRFRRNFPGEMDHGDAALQSVPNTELARHNLNESRGSPPTGKQMFRLSPGIARGPGIILDEFPMIPRLYSMKLTGNIRKMESAVPKPAGPVRYQLPVYVAGDQKKLFPISDAIGKKITLTYTGKIACIRCGRATKKSFNQGFCYPCFTSAPECSECIVRPELCRAHEGESRDMEWSKTYCLVDHVVYLAVSSDVKVGITRKSQVPTRWIDQGAHQAIQLAKTPHRFAAGQVEVALKKHLKDRTDWRKMLKNEYPANVDLKAIKHAMIENLPEELRKYAVKSDTRTAIEFPVLEYPVKVKSLGFDKEPNIAGKLMGIKGQYLIFDENRVINLRKHQGYEITIAGG